MNRTTRSHRPTRSFRLIRRLAPLALSVWLLPAGAADPPPPAAPAPSVSAAAATVAQGAPRANAPTRQALETLLSALPPGAGDGVVRVRVTAQRNESLDSVIRRTMGDSPFKEAFLRGVFLELNAAALQPGSTRLISGASLQVPTVADLREHLQRVVGPPAGAAAAASAAASPTERRAWVRFP